MELKELLSIGAGIVFVIGFLPYMRAILRGETKPAKASWLIWSALDWITLTGMYAASQVNGQIVGAAVGSLAIVALALKYGTPGWTRLDKMCLGGAMLGILLWQTFDNPVLAIITSATTAVIGSIPTMVSAWHNPSYEDKTAWTIFWVSCVMMMAAVPAWTLADATQPTAFFLIETIMMYILFIRPAFSRKLVRAL